MTGKRVTCSRVPKTTSRHMENPRVLAHVIPSANTLITIGVECQGLNGRCPCLPGKPAIYHRRSRKTMFLRGKQKERQLLKNENKRSLLSDEHSSRIPISLCQKIKKTA